MKFTIPLLFLASIVLLSSYTAVSDDLILKKTKSGEYEERYFVYKEQPTIKQDQYVKLYTNFMDAQKIVEIGSYELNQKTGMWMNFYYISITNMIKSFGTYVQGIKEEEWSYFYQSEKFYSLLSPLLNKNNEAINHTTLMIPKSKKEICILQLDTTNVRLMETGRYENGKKMGVWEYYSREGKLLHKYDHTTGRLLENNESPEKCMIYLGGFDRFNNFISYDIPIETMKNLGDTNKLDFLVKENGYELVAFKGDSVLIDLVMNFLNSTPSNWIRLTTDEKKSIHYIFQMLRSPDKKQIRSIMRFKYVDSDVKENDDLEPELLISPSN